jgi:predicted enzyme related to lactoylglutathione lyase
MGRPVVHFEFWSQDPGNVSEFYRNVFDWDIRSIPEMDYHLVQAAESGGIGGGIMKPSQQWSTNLTLYIDVDDLDKYGARIQSAGGTILIEKMAVPNVGEFSLFQDPDGRVLGLWKQQRRPE